MNAYEFIKKGYGSNNLSPLKLYLSLTHNPNLYQVTRLTDSRVDLLDNDNLYKFLGKNDNLQVTRVSFIGKLLVKKVILHLGRP